MTQSQRKARGGVWKRGDWKAIPGFPGYEASFAGRIRDAGDTDSPVIVKGSIGPCGFYTVQLGRTGRKYHQVGKLTALAWLGPMPPGSSVRYLDGNLQNHNAANLQYGTRREFYQDQAARATREEAAGAPTHCAEGHRYATHWFGGWGERLCNGCERSDYEPRGSTRDKQCEKCDAPMKDVHHTRKLCDECRGGHLQDKPSKTCGQLMVQVPSRQKTCDSCRNLRRKPTIQDKPCQDCGEVISQVHNARRLCDGCIARRDDEYQQLYRAGVRKGTYHDRPCQNCGAVIPQAHYQRRLCDNCQAEGRKEAMRKFNEKRRKENRG